ncbi:MAG: Spermidine-binding periplasmic protein SpuE [Gammaproteobacteria bacterium]|nr:Spermidine-binding periplasmic protein SpuE [Gammaproteobacteria bacterium]
MRNMLGVLIALCGFAGAAPAAEEKVLNLYNWTDYIGETTIADFEKETGIKVNYDTYDSNETLDAKLLTGNTGYDVTFPSASFFARQIQAGVFQKLDKNVLTNWGNLDPDLLKELAAYDPGNEYAVPYMWGTNGFSYNVEMIKARMPDAPVDSLDMLFKPEVISKFADCGVSFLDSPEDVIQLALNYLGLDPNTKNVDDLKKVEDLLMAVRPYVRRFDASAYLDGLPNGDVCIAMSWSGDFAVANNRAIEAGSKVTLDYTVPKEGANIWFDGMLIPKDAPHPQNAMLFLNFMLRPDVMAACTNFTYYANSNRASWKLVKPEILDDPRIFPTMETRRNLYGSNLVSDEMLRARTRLWTKIKTGQ